MSSRDKILAAVAAAQPDALPLPQVGIQPEEKDVVAQFTAVLTGIGGRVWHAADRAEALQRLQEGYTEREQVIVLPDHKDVVDPSVLDPHLLSDVDLAIITASIAVAENGAIWVTDAALVQRVLPFITQNLAVLVPKAALVATMHDAYAAIGQMDYGFGLFIAGPSKTADIEQSLVLGAHGSRSMTVVLLD